MGPFPWVLLEPALDYKFLGPTPCLGSWVLLFQGRETCVLFPTVPLYGAYRLLHPSNPRRATRTTMVYFMDGLEVLPRPHRLPQKAAHGI